MNPVVTTPLTPYEQACAACAHAMYHIAFVALGEEEIAEAVLTKVCVAGVHKYNRLDDTDQVMQGLFSDLYRKCKRKLWFYKPS